MHHHGSSVPARAKSHLALLEMGKKSSAREGNQAERKARAGEVRSADDWCCKACLGPDGQPYRNFGDRKVCRKCQVPKGSCFLRKADATNSRCPSSSIAERQARQRQTSLEEANRELCQKLAAKERELSKLAGGNQQGNGREGKDEVKSQLQQPASVELSAAKTLRKQIQQLKALDPDLRQSLCANKGGYDAFLKDLEGQLDAVCIKQREERPLSEQKASTEAHLKKMQRAKDDATSKMEKLQADHAELASKIAEQTATLVDIDAKLQKARVEVAAVTEKASAELRGAASGDSAVTASAVTSWFNKLPPEVAQHAEAQQAMQTVMALMGKLDHAKTAAQSASSAQPALSAAAAGQAGDAEAFDELDEMELDETQAAALAKRITSPKGDDEEEEQYQERIKVSSAKLRGGSLPLSGRGMLVKKTVQKK